MDEKVPFHRMVHMLNRKPQAVASVHGSREYATIGGFVYFYQMTNGVLVAARIMGLPDTNGIFGFHIHSGFQCTGTTEDPFANTLTHYNPGQTPHPHHAGDLPPLFGNHGFAFQVFFTDRFTVQEILNKTVVIHSGPDDFTSQPAGNAGKKIACGQIEPFEIRFPISGR